MRYPKTHKAEARASILQAASEELRRGGLHQLSISALMSKVGLTHGGFYAHFQSREELVAQAIESAGRQTQQAIFEQAQDLDALLARYLSMEHVRDAAHGCVVAALGTQAAAQPDAVKQALHQAAQGLIQLVQDKLQTLATPSDQALETASRMVGAIVLARLLHERSPALAERILKASLGAS